MSILNSLKRIFKNENFIVEDKVDESVSPLRSMMEMGGQYKLVSYKSLEEARTSDNSYLILEGDFGGQIFLTMPVKLVKTNEEMIRKLLLKLNDVTWGKVQQDGTGFYFEEIEPGQGVPGGMGGGFTYPDKLWIHKGLVNYKPVVEEVLTSTITESTEKLLLEIH